MTIATPVTPSIDTPRPFLFTREQYYQLADAGFFQGKRVQLIEGTIYTIAPQKNAHYLATNRTLRALEKVFDEKSYWVRSQGPLNLGQLSDPEPDIAVVAGIMGSLPDHPTSALLIVEISDTTLRFDRTDKASFYARAGIADYWIVNIPNRCLEVMRNPAPDANATHGFSYSSISTLKPPESLSPLANPTAQIPIADLLP